MMNCTEIRSTFVNFYQDIGFKLLPPAPMLHPSIPMSFVMSAGLVQIETSLANTRNCSGNKFVLVQNCFRHFDRGSVGMDALHLSLFEMSGAFVFGEINQKNAIRTAWELITDLPGIDYKRIWVSYFTGGQFENHLLPEDKESYSVWRNIGISENRIIGLEIDDNYWIQGGSLQGQESDLRKCGPHTELFYDRGSERKCNSSCRPGCRCGRFVEFANVLFISHAYCSQTNKFVELADPFVETVIGSERVAMILQKARHIFEIQGYRSVIKVIQNFSRQTNLPAELKTESERIIADHLRALCILIADGAPPPGRGGRAHIIKLLIRGVMTRQIILGIHSSDFLPAMIHAIFETFGDSVQNISNTMNKMIFYFEMELPRFQKTLRRGKDKIKRLSLKNGEKLITESQKLSLEKKWGMPDRLTELLLQEADLSLHLRNSSTKTRTSHQ